MTRPRSRVLLNGTALRVLREKDGHTLASLAALAGVTKSYISDLERGRRGGNAQVIRALADALNVPASLLEAPREDAA